MSSAAFNQTAPAAQVAQSILIVDPDLGYLEKIQKYYSQVASGIKVEIAETGAKAQTLIADRSKLLLGIFVNTRVARPSGISVIKASYFHRPATPLYILEDDQTDLSLSPSDLRSMGVRDVVKKSSEYGILIKLVAPVALSFDAQEILAKKQRDGIAAGIEISDSDSEYAAISAFDFLSGSQSLFDIFVRLNSGRYLKLLDSGDVFESARVESYLKKGVAHFYIKKEAQEGYLQFCNHLAEKIANLKGVSEEVRITQTLNVGDQALEFFKNNGVTETNIKYATSFVGLVNQVMKTADLTKGDPIQAFMDNATAYEHGVSASMTAAILSNAIEISFDKPALIIGVAAMLHDIGLYQLPEELWHEDETQMTPEQKKIYRTHPKKSADILRDLRRFDGAALQAIELHHQRRDGKGFPEIGGIGLIPRVAELVGISDQFDLGLRRAKKNPDFNLKLHMENIVFPGYSRQIVYAFRTAIFPRTV